MFFSRTDNNLIDRLQSKALNQYSDVALATEMYKIVLKRILIKRILITTLDQTSL